MSKKKLGIDLDHTIILADILEYAKYDFTHHFPNEMHRKYFWKRSHVDAFLSFALENFEVQILTAATKEFAEFVAENLGILGKVEIKDRAHWIKGPVKNFYGELEEDYIKAVNDTIVVDDKDYVVQGENNIVIKVKPCWTHADDELLKVIDQLKTLI